MSKIDDVMNKYIDEGVDGLARLKAIGDGAAFVSGHILMYIGLGIVYCVAVGVVVFLFPFWCLEKLIKRSSK